MAKHIWIFTAKKSKLGWSASGKHGNANKVIYLKGYNTLYNLERELKALFPNENYSLVKPKIK